MKTVQKSVLIWYSAAEMFSLVADVAHYPDFLPWCDHARVLDLHDDGLTAELGLSVGGLRQRFTTRNRYLANQQVEIRLVQGPFSKLEGVWTFSPVGEASERACRVDLVLHYGFEQVALARVIAPIFDKVASTLVDAFVARANQVYG